MRHFDEAFTPSGEPRSAYGTVIDALGTRDLGALRERTQREAAARGIEFEPGRPIAVDPVPRVIAASEWRLLEAGALQRARALNAFLVDAYGEGRIFAAGVVPGRLLDSPGVEPRMRGLVNPEVPPATVCGLDVVKDAEGKPLVLEDNVRMPSGAAYASALREVVEPTLEADVEPRPVSGFAAALGEAIAAAAPERCEGEPTVAILSDGPASGTWFEHRELAAALGAAIVTPQDLEAAHGRVFARVDGRRRRIDVLYRRLDEERLSDADGAPTEIGELLLPALEAGRLRCLNCFGAGLADDKLVHAHDERMIRFYLEEDPVLRSVPTIDLGGAAEAGRALGRLDSLVIKPRDGFGGHGVTIMPAATETERRRAIGLVRRRPGRFVAQEVVPLSSHPTVCDGRLRPRRVDLRPFVVSGRDGAVAMPGGLTRYARDEDGMLVNSSQGGGCKDTWVVDR